MPRVKSASDDVPVTFRLPAKVQRTLIEKARIEDMNFSQIVRRAVRRELKRIGSRVNGLRKKL